MISISYRPGLATAAVLAFAGLLAAGGVQADSRATEPQLGAGSATQAPHSAATTPLKRPRGTYTGQRGRLKLWVSGGSIELAAFEFACGNATGRTSLNGIEIRKRRGRYRFSIRTYGNVTYRDEHPDENAAVRLSGRFSRSARRATGTFRVTSPRCGSSGDVNWIARR